MPKDRLVSARNHRDSEEILKITVTNSMDGKDSTEYRVAVFSTNTNGLHLGQRSAAGLSTATTHQPQ